MAPSVVFLWSQTIEAQSLNSLSPDDFSNDPESDRLRSIAEILLKGIRRCAKASASSEQIPATDQAVLDNLGDFLPKPLDFAAQTPLTVSYVSKTLGFGADRDTSGERLQAAGRRVNQ